MNLKQTAKAGVLSAFVLSASAACSKQGQVEGSVNPAKSYEILDKDGNEYTKTFTEREERPAPAPVNVEITTVEGDTFVISGDTRVICESKDDYKARIAEEGAAPALARAQAAVALVGTGTSNIAAGDKAAVPAVSLQLNDNQGPTANVAGDAKAATATAATLGTTDTKSIFSVSASAGNGEAKTAVSTPVAAAPVADTAAPSPKAVNTFKVGTTFVRADGHECKVLPSYQTFPGIRGK